MIAKILDINIKHSLLKKFLRSATAKFFFFFFSTLSINRPTRSPSAEAPLRITANKVIQPLYCSRKKKLAFASGECRMT